MGETGSRKSETASLAQRHYGKGMDRTHLPGSWENTANYNEAVGFYAKDCLFVVDDWLLRGTLSDMERANRDADRLMRGQGNGAGRGRCSYDGKPRPARPSRCLMMATAEAVPDGLSLGARMFILPLGKEDIDCAKLTECQRHAENGTFAAAMAGYLSWLAGARGSVRADIREQVEAHRNTYLKEHPRLHPRTATIAAELLGGFTAFLWFAEQVGAIDGPRQKELFDTMVSAMDAAVVRQKRQHRDQDPVEQYLQLLGELFASGRAHLQNLSGGCPDENPQRWGWAEKTYRVPKPPTATGTTAASAAGSGDEEQAEGQWEERTVWQVQGQHIGYISVTYLYLLPAVSLGAVQELARRTNTNLPLTPKTLGRELHRKGVIELREEKRGVYTQRVNVASKRIEVYCLAPHRVLAPEFSHPWDPEDGPPPTLDDLLDA
ncbi:hypothetical protein [Gemmata sp.]|uniref:hypothetical protein n=1 Tax=Gemmata sp. TaxID=1914242 RepID=UPI003F6FE954